MSNIIYLCVKLAAKRQAQETESVLSPELSPPCLKTGALRRCSSARRRSYRMFSEETEEEKENLDPLDDPMVQCLMFLSSLNFLLNYEGLNVCAICVSVASPVSHTSAPTPGHPLLSSTQHQKGKPKQHFRCFPCSPQLRG